MSHIEEIRCFGCGEVVKSSIHDTGIESYCKCQCTLDADFDGELWESVFCK